MARNKKKSKAPGHTEHNTDPSVRDGGKYDEGTEVADRPMDEDDNEATESCAAALRSEPQGDGDKDDTSPPLNLNKKKRLDEIAARREAQTRKKAGNAGNKTKKTSVETAGVGHAKEDHAKEGDFVETDSDASDDEVVVTRQEPVAVLYCPVCTFPAEMCEFSGMMEKCRPWLQEHAAELADAEERGRKRRILTEKDRLEAMLEGRGVKKALERIVVIEQSVGEENRKLTLVFGMDLFGFNLTDLSKEWRKTFACGVGVKQQEEGKHQKSLSIQGNVVDRLVQLLVKKYAIPKDAVYITENKKKKPYFE